MSAMPQNVRATDRTDLSGAGRGDFVVRKRELTREKVISLSLSVLLVIIGVSILVYNDTLMGSALTVLVGLLLYFFARHLERNEKALQATQFLNAMFSSLLAHGYKFSCIATTEGEIVYLDRAFQGMFPELMRHKDRTLAMLAETYRASEPQKLAAALKEGKSTSFPLSIEGGDNHAQFSLTVSFDPVPRPSGFVMIRGK